MAKNTMSKSHPVFRTQYNRKPEIPKISSQPDATIPDQAMSINEILVRFAQGRPVQADQNFTFTGDDYQPDTFTMDRLDAIDLMRQNQSEMDQMEYDLSKKQDAIKQKRAKLKAERAQKKEEQKNIPLFEDEEQSDKDKK